MKVKEFLNSHKLVVISDFIKSIEAIPEQKWLHDFMQNELAYLIECGMNWVKHDDDAPVDMIRSAAWLKAICRAYSGSHPVLSVGKPSDIIREWSVKKDAKQYAATFKIEIDTSDAQAALAALEEQIQSIPRLKVISGDVIGVSRANSGKSPVTLIVKSSDIVQEFSNRHDAEKYEATLCCTDSSGSIEQQTLSTVLGNTLHNIPVSNASSVAVELAQAVKAAFDVLENKNATPR
ncbi:hypothetical protein F3E67_20675 [Salmonella enterica subsp. salamae]|nr:hypothetical protein [Salmonella enterica subsp. enterica serovar Typhimurium]ECW0140719.1 hypothetical protein [Salmonella enterica subsp. salamae]